MPVEERGEWKSVKFVVQETDGQYPQSCVFTKSAKGDNGKYIDEFEKNNPIGSFIEVDYTFKSREYNGKWYTDITAFKTVNVKYQQSTETANQPKGEEKKKDGISQEEYNKTVDSLSGGSHKEDKTPGLFVEDDLPFRSKVKYKYSIQR